MSTTSPTIGLFRDLVDLPFRLLGLERAPRALTAPLTRSAPSSAPVLFRSAGHQVALDPDSVEQAFPHATDRLVLFVPEDRKSVVSGKSVSVRVDLGRLRLIKKTTIKLLFFTPQNKLKI